jgi:23S rRNA (guanine745-N1)-methyltransferase
MVLARTPRAWVCAGGHSFDIARSGYVNLLQPQDRRSRVAGDSVAALDARERLLTAGIGRNILDGFAGQASRLVVTDPPCVIELGCGAGDVLAAVAGASSHTGVGIDVSVAAIHRAARRFPDQTWVVANADRSLPFADRSVSMVLSFHGRRNPSECARVLDAGGWLLVAVPAPDDLVELRAAVQGTPAARDRGDAVISDHEPAFALRSRATLRERHRLDRVALVDLLHGTYRGARRAMADRMAALGTLEVTLASEVLAFARLPSPR